MSIIIGRPINGISLNGNEFLLDNEGNFIEFENSTIAKQFLIDNGHENWSDDDLTDAYNFIEY